MKSASNITIFGDKLCFDKFLFAVYSKHPYMFLFFNYCRFYVKKWPFFVIFPFFGLFSPRWGVEKKFFDKKWLKYILTTFLHIENIIKIHKTVFGRNYRRFLHIGGTRFLGISLLILKKSKNCPSQMTGDQRVAHKSYAKYFFSGPFGSVGTYIQSLGMSKIFSPLTPLIA